MNIQRKHIQQAFILYGCALFYAVFLTPNRYRGDGSIGINLVPVINTYRQFYGQGTQPFWDYYIGYWGNIFGNIILFVPFGFLFKNLYPQTRNVQVCLYGVLLSIMIELMQLVLQIGVCDIDDAILNFLGVLAGVKLYAIMKKKKPGWFAASE